MILYVHLRASFNFLKGNLLLQFLAMVTMFNVKQHVEFTTTFRIYQNFYVWLVTVLSYPIYLLLLLLLLHMKVVDAIKTFYLKYCVTIIQQLMTQTWQLKEELTSLQFYYLTKSEKTRCKYFNQGSSHFVQNY